MLYLATRDGETLPQSLINIRSTALFPFQVMCIKPNKRIPVGTTFKIINYKLGKYQTSDGMLLTGEDKAWLLVV